MPLAGIMATKKMLHHPVSIKVVFHTMLALSAKTDTAVTEHQLPAPKLSPFDGPPAPTAFRRLAATARWADTRGQTLTRGARSQSPWLPNRIPTVAEQLVTVHIGLSPRRSGVAEG